MIIQAALNGARSKAENKFIPHNFDEIKNDVDGIFNSGGRVFHIHVYNQAGNESLADEDVTGLISGIRRISDLIKVGISTGEWIIPDFDERLKNIGSWKSVPDFASVNMIEEGAVEIAALLVKKGTRIEAGLNDSKAAEIFLKNIKPEMCERILIEPENEILQDALTQVGEIENLLNKAHNNLPRLLHGFNSTCWPLIKEAYRKGYDTRIGMEDTLFMENGEAVRSNLELFKEVKDIYS